MASIERAQHVVTKQIEELEEQTYVFETILLARYEVDKKLLNQLRQDALKLEAIKKRRDAGEHLTAEDIRSAVPKQFL